MEVCDFPNYFPVKVLNVFVFRSRKSILCRAIFSCHYGCNFPLLDWKCCLYFFAKPKHGPDWMEVIFKLQFLSKVLNTTWPWLGHSDALKCSINSRLARKWTTFLLLSLFCSKDFPVFDFIRLPIGSGQLSCPCWTKSTLTTGSFHLYSSSCWLVAIKLPFKLHLSLYLKPGGMWTNIKDVWMSFVSHSKCTTPLCYSVLYVYNISNVGYML